MHKILSDKKVIFFDVGYTIDYPASGDWVFTNKFNELAGERLRHCSPDLIAQAKMAGLCYLENNHFIRDEKEEVDRFCRYYGIISELLQLEMTEEDIMAAARDRTFNMDS